MRDDEGVDRTDRRLKLAIRLAILPGFVAATYLTYTKLAHVEPVCGTGGCAVINNSDWSEVAGVPVTLIGMITYLLMFASTFLASDLGKIGGAFLAVTGAAFSVFLQYEALIVLERTCPWCLTSAAAMLILSVLTVTRLLRIPSDDGSGEPAGDSAAAA